MSLKMTISLQKALMIVGLLLVFSPASSFADNPLKPFTSDGCSISPDGYPWQSKSVILECCVAHDLAYWRGGTSRQREIADQELRTCIKDRTNTVVASSYYYMVYNFGTNFMNWDFSWGYGWTRKRPYRQLTPDEMEQVEARMYEIDWDQIYSSILGK